MRFHIIDLEAMSAARLYGKVVKKIDVNKNTPLLRETKIQSVYKNETADTTEQLNNAVKADGGTIPDKPNGVNIAPNDDFIVKGDGIYIETKDK